MKPKTPKDLTSGELTEAFLAELDILSVRVDAVASLRRGAVARYLAEQDRNPGDLSAKVLNLMDDIDASFQIIRRKLGS